ncbi:MAG: OmpA family protein [Acidobacteriota bacterium]
MTTNPRSQFLPSLLISVAALLLLGGGSCQKKTDFTSAATPTPVKPDGGNPSGSESNSTAEPIGSDFAEKPLGDTENTNAEEAAIGNRDADEVATNMATVYFEYDSFTLSDRALATLTANAAWLRTKPGVRVVIEGHCDERGSIEYNLDLGAKRARIVKDQLVRLGVEASRLSTVSKGEAEPVDTASSEAAYAVNRRAEFEKAP